MTLGTGTINGGGLIASPTVDYRSMVTRIWISEDERTWESGVGNCVVASFADFWIVLLAYISGSGFGDIGGLIRIY